MSEGHFTVIIKPVPRGIGRDELVSNHLLPFGQIRAVRFGEGRGAAGDMMFVDYFEPESAVAAVAELNGKRDPGTSHLILSVSLAKTTEEAIKRLKSREPKPSARPGLKVTETVTDVPDGRLKRVRPKGGFKYLRPRDSGREVCIIDFSQFR